MPRRVLWAPYAATYLWSKVKQIYPTRANDSVRMMDCILDDNMLYSVRQFSSLDRGASWAGFSCSNMCTPSVSDCLRCGRRPCTWSLTSPRSTSASWPRNTSVISSTEYRTDVSAQWCRKLILISITSTWHYSWVCKHAWWLHTNLRTLDRTRTYESLKIFEM